MLLTVALALLAGATVQSLVGLGLGLVAAPVVTLVEPGLMPDVMLWLACGYPALTLATDRADIDWGGLAWSLPMRVLGTAAGVAAVAVLSTRFLGVVVGVMVLVASVLTWRTVRVPLTRPSLLVAGLVSGFAGTATSIGGPPMAIMFAHRPPQETRASLGVFFLVGTLFSLGLFAATGQMPATSLWLTLLYLPLVVGAFVVGVAVRGRIPATAFRRVVLAVCAGSAVVLLVRSLL